jgi:CHAT domain-containing protein
MNREMWARISRRAFLKWMGAAGLVASAASIWPRLVNAWAVSSGAERVDQLLGASLLYDEYKGDFGKARGAAIRLLADARRDRDSQLQADALMTLGLVQFLQGEGVGALASFVEAESLAGGDATRRLRVLTYRYATDVLRFNAFPNGSGGSGAELEARWDGLARATSYDGDYRALKPEVGRVAAILETDLVVDQCCSIRSIRAALDAAMVMTPLKGMEPIILQTIGSQLGFRVAWAQSGADPRILAYLDRVIADLYHRVGDHGRAREYLERSASVYRSMADWAGLAGCSLVQGDWIAAPYSSPAVMNAHLVEGMGDTGNPSWSIESLELEHPGGAITQARRLYDEAEAGYQRAGAPRGIAAIALRRGYLAARAGDHGAAVGFATMARSGFEAAGDHLGAMAATVHLSLHRVGAGELAEDRAEALRVGRWGAEEGSYSHVLGLGLMAARAGRHWLLRAGDFERASSCYRFAEALFEGLGARLNRAQSFSDLGMLMRWMGEHGAAVTLSERAADICNTVADDAPKLTAVARQRALFLLAGLIQIHVDRGDPDALERAEQRLEATLDRLQANAATDVRGDWADRLATLTDDSVGSSSEASSSAASRVMDNAIVTFARDQVVTGRVMVPALKAKAALKAGDTQAAADWLERALEATDGIPAGTRRLYRAIAYAYVKDDHTAKTEFDSYLAEGGANAGFAGRIARLLAKMGGESGRAELLRQSRRTHEQAAAFYTRINAYESAKTHLDLLESLAGPTWWEDSERPWETLGDYGAVYEGLDQFQAAAEYYQQGIDAFESRRRQLRRDELKTALSGVLGAQYLYFGAARNALKRARVAEEAGDGDQAQKYRSVAYGYAEQGKSRGLLDLMASGAMTASLRAGSRQTIRIWHEANTRLATWRGVLAAEQSQKQPSSDRVTYLAQRISDAEGNLRRAESAVAVAEPAFYRAIDAKSPLLDARQIAEMLPGNAALLQYYFLGDHLMVWGVSRDGELRAHLAPRDSNALVRQIKGLHRACERRQPFANLAGQLAEIFLAPMADLIKAKQRLIIVPYGAAHLLPFHVLPWEDQPLAFARAVSYLPSASLLQFTGQPRNPIARRDGILAVGNPSAMASRASFDSVAQPQPPLPAAEAEAHLVAGLFPMGQALTGAQATKPAVMAALDRFPLLHFATHGILSDESPLLSSLLLADGEAITVYELMGLQLKADLVVLSACRTGQGQTTGGDDVLGFTRGLLAAGARAAMVGLWPVDDLATSMLMSDFYRELGAGQAPAVALQRAQNDLRQLGPDQIRERAGQIRGAVRGTVLTFDDRNAGDYSHPFYWAPFVLVG